MSRDKDAGVFIPADNLAAGVGVNLNDITMTPSQRKRLFEIISTEELDWTEFSVENHDSREKIISRLIHKPTELYFEISYNEMCEGLEVGAWEICQSPGENLTPKAIMSGFIKTWNNVEDYFISWIKLLKKEIESKNFIEEILKYRINLYNNSNQYSITEEQFSPEEKKTIQKTLNNFKEEINKYDILTNEIEQLNQRIDYLINRLDKNYPKIDWLNIFISTIVSSLANEGILLMKSPETFEQIKLLFHIITGGNFLK